MTQSTEKIVTLKEFVQRAYEMIAEMWVQNAFYSETTDFAEALEEDAALDPNQRREEVRAVCSVGAMRLAFADLVGIPIHEDTLGNTWVDADEVDKHPLYQEGMKALGKAFYESDLLSAVVESYAAEAMIPEVRTKDQLLNGLGGRPYTIQDVARAIIRANDVSVGYLTEMGRNDTDLDDLRAAIVAAFQSAVEEADPDISATVVPNSTATVA